MSNRVIGLKEALDVLRHRKDVVVNEMPKLTHDNAVFLRDEIVAHAHGRPGPEEVTGKYIASWKAEGNEVTTDAPQAMALEYGFVGVDARGRNQSKPPLPHIRPAMAIAAKQFFQQSIGLVRKASNAK